MAIKLADTLAPMADFPAAMAEHIAFADGKTLQEKVDNGDFAGGGEGGPVVVDTVVSDTSENPIQNKVIKKYVDDEIAKVPSGESVTVDTVVSDTSENPIQNKVIKKYVDDEIAKVPSGESVTVDTVVSDTSENPIQNKVIKKYVDDNLTGVQTELADVKKELGDGMTLVADAITAKGIETATDATLEVMAGNIRAIEQGVDTSDATATATDIMAGKTAWVNGVKITGIATSSELHGATISVSSENAAIVGIDITLLKDGAVVGTRIMDENLVCSFSGIQDPGEYVVGIIHDTLRYEENVSITVDNIINKTVLSCVLSLIPDGSTVTPTDNVAIWQKCAGLNADYITIAEVLADNDTMFALTSDENAMKYLERSTSFADGLCSDETFMTYLGQSPYVESTVLNSDLWVSTTSSSSYWDLIYPSVTVHSSASATINVAGKTFTSDTSGNTQHSMPWGTFSISDSVSGRSFECTIDKDTTDVYVMPYGALYWNGNECASVTGGWSSDGYKFYNDGGSERKVEPSYIKNSDNIYLYCNGSACAGVIGTASQIDTSKYSKLYVDAISYGRSPTDQCMGVIMGTSKESKRATRPFGQAINANTNQYNIRGLYCFDISSLGGTFYVYFACEAATVRKGNIYQVWLE